MLTVALVVSGDTPEFQETGLSALTASPLPLKTPENQGHLPHNSNNKVA